MTRYGVLAGAKRRAVFAEMNRASPGSLGREVRTKGAGAKETVGCFVSRAITMAIIVGDTDESVSIWLPSGGKEGQRRSKPYRSGFFRTKAKAASPSFREHMTRRDSSELRAISHGSESCCFARDMARADRRRSTSAFVNNAWSSTYPNRSK